MSYTIREGTEHLENSVGVPALGVGQDGSYKALRTHEPDPFSSNEVNVPAVHVAAVVTLPAGPARMANVITGVAFSYSGTGTLSGGRLTIADGSETVFDLDISAKAADSIEFSPPRRGRPGRAMTITLADGGVDVQGKMNVLGHWYEHVPQIGEGAFDDESDSGLLPLFF